MQVAHFHPLVSKQCVPSDPQPSAGIPPDHGLFCLPVLLHKVLCITNPTDLSLGGLATKVQKQSDPNAHPVLKNYGH